MQRSMAARGSGQNGSTVRDAGARIAVGTGGRRHEAEFDAFEKAEIAQVSASRAERAAAAAVEKLNAAQHGLPPKLDALCEKTGTRPEGIKVLMTYYTENSGWTEQQAVEHIEKLFADGTIEALKKFE